MSPRPGTRLAVLLVDDQQATRSACRRLLRRHDVTEAASAADALALLASGYVPHVVLCDFHLGDASGLDVLAAVKRLAPDALRLLMTAAPEAVPAERAAGTAEEIIDKLSDRFALLLATI